MTYLPSIWDRLTGPGVASPSAAPLTPAQRKAAIARDLEALLNTRVALPAGLLDGHPACADSIVNYGLVDFAQLCLTSSADRRQVCDRLAASIVRHEPRLGNVRAELAGGTVNRLAFVVSATMRAGADDVDFSVLLEPSSLRYSIR